MASAKQSIPFVVPAQHVPAVCSIPQQELARILELRQEIALLEAEAEAQQNAVRAQLEAGASVEPGLLRAFLKTTERRSVQWKAVCERELGEEYARRVLAATKPDTFTNLVVTA
jgi:hypothetical protein